MDKPLQQISKPQAGEFPEYASMYIDLIPDDGLVLSHMLTNFQAVSQAIYALPEEKLKTPHAEGEWTVQDILVHIIDDERIYAYRALRFARGDIMPIPGFDQDSYIAPSNANQRALGDIFAEYKAVRESTIALFNSFDASVLLCSGTADGKQATVRALAYHIAGHELHHLHSIQENYG